MATKLIRQKEVTKTVTVKEDVVGSLKIGDWVKGKLYSDYIGVVTNLGKNQINLVSPYGVRWSESIQVNNTGNITAAEAQKIIAGLQDVEVLTHSEVLEYLAKEWKVTLPASTPTSPIRVFTCSVNNMYYKVERGKTTCSNKGEGMYWGFSCVPACEVVADSRFTELFGPHKENVLKKHTKPELRFRVFSGRESPGSPELVWRFDGDSKRMQVYMDSTYNKAWIGSSYCTPEKLLDKSSQIKELFGSERDAVLQART